MILFRDDWDLYPDAIVDTATTNVSFLRMAALYRDMGVKNHSFILSLINPELKGLDPFDGDPSIERMMLMTIEAKQNFWWFLRSCVRIPTSSSANPILFRPNRGNIALYWLFFNHITTILVQIRQTGKSLSVNVLMSYLLNLRCVNTEINAITKDDKLRTETLSRLKSIDEEFPFFLKQRNKKDISNTEELTINSLNNNYRSHLPSKSPKQALNLGRGFTGGIFPIDEGAFIFNIEISLPAALAAGTAARDNARANNEPYGTIITTTAGKKDDKDGRYVFNLLEESTIWNEQLLDLKDEKELEFVIRKNSSNGKLRVNCTFNHRQLGYTDEWLRQAIEDSLAVGEEADRDFFNKWTSGTQSSPLSVELTERIRNSEINDFTTEIDSTYGYVTRWYKTKEEIISRSISDHFIISIDTSDAVGGDDIGLVIRSVKTGEVLGAGNYNETNLITFCEWLVNWFVRFEHMTMVIERRSTGAMIIDYLILFLVSKGIDPFKRIYNKVVNEQDEFPDRYREICKPMYARNQETYVRLKKTFGFATSGSGATSRTELYSTTLLNSAKYTGDKVYDSTIINQILGLETKNGRIDHPVGSHDDLCIAWLLGYWFLSQAKYLDHYGINSRMILVDNKQRNNGMTTIQIYDELEQKQIREEIEQLVEQITNTRDEFIVMKMENKLRAVAQHIRLGENEVFSVDELIRSLHDKRKINRFVDNRNNYRPYY